MSGLEGLLAGRVLGDRYRIEEVIGRGGMGAVYRALDERLHREVAVKVVTVVGALDQEARERLRVRFLREARAAAALPHHPNVVPVYDYGTDPALGLDYIVMELLRGADLADHLARATRTPLPAALKILYEAARGVSVGHRAGLIHRDVKPGNLFLADDHGEVQVRVLDFGIAKLMDDGDTLAHLTQDGLAPHSPAYASPEQLRGLGDLTPASDVFSLGAVGFQLLTGERPFTDADRNRLSLGMPVPVPPVRERNPAIPGMIAKVVERALVFDPGERHPDAGAMAAELGQALRSLPDVPLDPYLVAPSPSFAPTRSDSGDDDDDRTRVMPDDRTLVAPPPPPPGRGVRGAAPGPPRPLPPPALPAERRRGWGSFVVWTLVLLVLGAAGLAVWLESGSAPRVAEEPVIPPPPDSLPNLAPGRSVVAETLGTQPELDALVQNQEGMRMLAEGDTAGALEMFRLARDLSRENPDYAYNYAFTLLRSGQAGRAAVEFQRVLSLDPSRTGAYYNLGVAQLQLGDTSAAWTNLQQVRQRATAPAERAAALRLIRDIERADAPAAAPVPSDTPGAGVPPPALPLDSVALPRDTARTG